MWCTSTECGSSGATRRPPPDLVYTLLDKTSIIFDELVYGRFEETSRSYLRAVIEVLGARGCDAVVLACTEIPLLVTEGESPLPAIDSTRTLARAALREATRNVSA